MMAIVFGGVVLVMIWAGVLISRLAEIGKADQNKKTWIWGVLLLVFLILNFMTRRYENLFSC